VSVFENITWSLADDEVIVKHLNTYSDKFDVDPLNISIRDFLTYLRSKNIFNDISITELDIRYSRICILNRSAEFALPFTDFDRLRNPHKDALLLKTDIMEKTRENLFPISNGLHSSFNSSFHRVKKLIFTRKKLMFWNQLIKKTTTRTVPNEEEYTRPHEMKEISINRIEATNLRSNPSLDSLPFDSRLSKSIFGQLLNATRHWEDRGLRRSYVHVQDAGQARTFFVKLIGEGADDQGGPYRAVFQTAIAEEASELLHLFTPCSNSSDGYGLNRDKLNFNPAFVGDEDKLALYNFLGKLVGIACRHNIMVSLSLPSIVWKPLAQETLSFNDLAEIDAYFTQSLREIKNNTEAYNDTDSFDLLIEELARSSPQLRESLLSSIHKSQPSEDACSSASSSLSATPDKSVISRLLDLVVHLRLISHEKAFLSFYHGLGSIIPVEVFSMFTAEEIEYIFCGEADIDLETLKKATVYDGDVNKNDRHVQFLWEALESMTPAQRSQFINFCSGRTRLPASASDFPMPFKIQGPPSTSSRNPDAHLPVARTCFFSLSLPQYTSLEVCKSKILYAIANTELMDADVLLRNADGWDRLT